MKKHILILSAIFIAGTFGYSYAQSVSIRKNYKEMGPMEITDFNDALQQFWNMGSNSATSGLPTTTSYLADFAIMHFEIGVSASGTHTSIHNSIYFLPWHRAFLLDYEQRIKQHSKTTHPIHPYDYLAVPYWDWRDEADPLNNTNVSSTTHPDFLAYAVVPDVNFSGWNFSYTSPVLGSPTTINFFRPTTFWPPSSINSNAGPAVVSSVMSSSPFYDWSSAWTGFTNQLENTPHNSMHGFIGGVMGSYYSPLDPIFFMHHNMVDKIWQDWEENSTLSYASTDLTTLPYSAIPPGGSVAVTYPSSLPLYTTEQCFDKVDSRYINFGGNMYDVWFAENGKVLINGNKGSDFIISGSTGLNGRIYRYTVYDASSFSYENGEMYVGDIARSGSSVTPDSKGGVTVTGGVIKFRAGKSISFRPGFTVTALAAGDEVSARTISSPNGL
jgi:hypothetical protein